MARVPNKRELDPSLDFERFLNDLQDWELFKDKKKKTTQGSDTNVGDDKRSPGKPAPTVDYSKSSSTKYDHSRNLDAINRISSGFMDEDSTVDAASEKELGNEHFKQKKFNEAIDCYSRSIALSPTAVAFANRAMAYLKIRRSHEAENDCTEALHLDDRYTKAYSRRATARRELGKLKESLMDAEFAMKLEPNNQEIKKQFTEVKSLLQNAIFQKASGEGTQKGAKLEAVNGHGIHAVSGGTQRKTTQKDKNKENGEVLAKKAISVEEIKGERKDSREVNDSLCNATSSSIAEQSQKRGKTERQELKASVQELASRAASRAIAEAAKNIAPPNSAYQFEVSWRGFSGDRALQAQLLKVTSPSSLPQIFKNALTAPMLLDIIKCVATFFTDDVDLAVKYLECLTKVPRFSMLIMCLSSTDKADILKLWNEVFCGQATQMEYAENLNSLQTKYCL